MKGISTKQHIYTKKELSEAPLYVAVDIFTFTEIISNSSAFVGLTGSEAHIYVLFKLFRYSAYLLCVLCMVLKGRYSVKGILGFGIASSAVLLATIYSKDNALILYMLFLGAAAGTDGRKLIKVFFRAQSIGLISIILTVLFGFVDNYVRFTGGRDRHFLGFSWATTAPILFLFIVMQYIYLKKGIVSIAEYIILLLLGVWFYIQTRTRMAFIVTAGTLSFFLLCGRYLKDKSEKGNRIGIIYKIIPASPWICATASFWAVYIYGQGGKWMIKMNDLLAGRLKWSLEGLKDYGVSLWGQPIVWIGNNINETLRGAYNYVDCSYIQIFLKCGIIYFLIVLIAYTMILRKAVQDREYYLCWIIVFVLGFSMTEPRLVNLMYNPFILLCVTTGNACRMYRSNKGELDEKRGFHSYAKTEIIDG